MGLADELDVGGEVMMIIKFRPLSFDLRNRAHDGMIHCHKEAEKLYGVELGACSRNKEGKIPDIMKLPF